MVSIQKEQRDRWENLRQRFTGKERDAESGLDYFGARYCSGAQGRFTSADTVITAEPSNPQSWNKYAYAFNRPLILVDPDGRWPTAFHHTLIENLFSGLGERAVRLLQNASDWVDSAGNQGTPESYMHGMSDGDARQTVEQARHLTTAYVDAELRASVDAQIAFEKGGGKGFADATLTRFGHALHTVTDMTSPQHVGFQPWYGLNSYSSWVHKKSEERSATSHDVADAEARYNAQVEAARLWGRLQAELEAERKRREKEEEERRKREN